MCTFLFVVPIPEAHNWIKTCTRMLKAISVGFSDFISRSHVKSVIGIAENIYRSAYTKFDAAQFCVSDDDADLMWLDFNIDSDEETVHYR